MSSKVTMLATPESDIESYKVGKFVWVVDGNSVILTKDDGASIITVNMYTYSTHEAACNAAYRMAVLQSKT